MKLLYLTQRVKDSSEQECFNISRDAGTGGGGAVALYQEGEGGAKVPFQFKGLPWRNSELSEMLV
jgi:hypothetical protein